MSIPPKAVIAQYLPSGIGHYDGNPFIEALPPILETPDLVKLLKGKIDFKPSDQLRPPSARFHLICQILNNFFHPIARHIDLERKLSILLREGYVGRNISTGELNRHIQSGYARTMAKDIAAFRYAPARSTAHSMSLIGCSGCGKTSTINRILATYPQVIFHENYNFTQIVYLKIDCPHDGSQKSLCLHFFRAIDDALGTSYETKYVSKRHGTEALLHLMRHIANLHAIGLLIIDEIQHLSIKKSGGADKMLNFFVTLVNVVGLPVVMIGTPKARPLFEDDLRSARRGAGIGSLPWEPMKNEPNYQCDDGTVKKSEWNAFTDALWKYQWLTKADVVLTDEVRECWYELSQGILDITVKLFVMAQIRAISSDIERITIKILKQTYQEEFKPVHQIIEALKSGDPNRIARYSDLIVPEMDHQLLKLQALVDKRASESDDLSEYRGNEVAIRLHHVLLQLGYDSDLLVSTVKRAVHDHPGKGMKELMSIVLVWLNEAGRDITKELPEGHSKASTQRKTTKKVKQDQWHTLDSDDLRFQFSQKGDGESFYEYLKQNTSLIFDMDHWLEQVG